MTPGGPSNLRGRASDSGWSWEASSSSSCSPNQGADMAEVRMSCEGCAGAVRRVLGKMEAEHSAVCKSVESFDIDMEEQKVTVKGTAAPEAVLERVSKTGKKAEIWKDELQAKEEAAPPAAAAAPPIAAAAAAAAAPEDAAAPADIAP